MNYVAIIGDIKGSKQISNRSQIQKKLGHVLKDVNETYKADISAKFIITLGDEFQGLLGRSKYVFDIIKFIQKEMYPVRLRFGVGIGEISTDVFSEAALGADGPAYYAARKMMEQLREQEKKLKKQAADIQISIYNTDNFEVAELNMILLLLKIAGLISKDLQYWIWNKTVAARKNVQSAWIQASQQLRGGWLMEII